MGFGHPCATGKSQRHSSALWPTVITLILVFGVSSTIAQNVPEACFINQGETRPGGTFAYDAWMQQGQCVRAGSASYEVCRNRLQKQLENWVDGLHQQEYSAAATVLALLPTIGAFVGTPSRELWPLLSIFPIAAVLVITMSFGGDLSGSNLDDYKGVLEKKGMKCLDWSGEHLPASLSEWPTGEWSRQRERLHRYISAAFGSRYDRVVRQSKSNAKLSPLKFNLLIAAGIFFLLGLLAAALTGIGIVEQGAVYATWCTSTWWMHLWYLVVTGVAIFDQWIQTPFTKRWTVYITSQSGSDITPETGSTHQGDIPVSNTLRHLMSIDTPHAFRNSIRTSSCSGEKSHSAQNSPTDVQSHTTVLTISIKVDEDRTPAWITALRLFSRAVSVTIYVFGTSIFAAVALLALPMSQMILILIMGAGVFSRALAAGLISLMREQGLGSVVLVCTDSEVTADRLLVQALEFGSSHKNTGPIFEVDGRIWSGGKCVDRRSRWWRLILGMLVRPAVVAPSDDSTSRSISKTSGVLDVKTTS